MKFKGELFSGNKGQYAIEFDNQEDGSVLAKATGPVPFGTNVVWTSEVASAAGKTKDDALRLLIDILHEKGA